jgi:hypothetical protein
MKKNRIIITIEGGLIQGVTADNPKELDILIMDYDCEGGDNVPKIRNYFGDRKLEDCNIYISEIGTQAEDGMIDNYFHQYENISRGIAI